MTADVISTFTPFVVFTSVLSTDAGHATNAYSTPHSVLGTCPLLAVCQPLVQLHQSQTNPAAETFRLPLCSCARPSPPQPAAPNIQRATGLFKQRAPTQSDLFTGRGRFRGKMRKVQLKHDNLRDILFTLNL